MEPSGPAFGLLSLRRVPPAWLALVTVLFTALVGATLAGTVAGIGAQVLPRAATARLASSPQRSVTVIALGGAGEIRSNARSVGRALGRALHGIPYRLDSAVWSGPLAVAAGPATGQQAEIAAAPQLRAQAALVRGAWPGAAPSGGPIPAALPIQLAAQLGAVPGTQLRLRDLNSGGPLLVRVTGIYRQRSPAAGYWNLDQIWTCSASLRNCPASHGPILVEQASFGSNGLAVAQASWVALPDASGIGPGELDPLAARIDRARSALQSPNVGLVVTTSLPALLRGTATTLAVARSVAVVAGAQLLVPAIAALALAAGLLASHREQETALLTARGAQRRQHARLALLEGVPIGVVAAVAGAFAGAAVEGLLSGQGAQLPSATVWLAELGVVVIVAVVMPVTSLRAQAARGGSPRRGTRSAETGLVRAGADLALVALAAIAVWQLRTSSVTVAGLDPVLIAAPVLALGAISVLLLRAVPLGARLADRVSARSRHFGTALAAWELGRRPVRQAGPVVLAVFTVAAGTLALAQHESWQRSAQDQAGFATGAEVRADLGVPIPLGRVGALTRARGVRAAMPEAVVSSGDSGEVLAIDARTAPAVVLLRPDLSPVPLAALSRRLVPPGPKPGLALPGRPARLRVAVALTPPSGVSLRPATIAVSIEDASGAVYSLPAGTLAPDGRPHSLVVVLTRTESADYPLRLLGLSLTYQLPMLTPSGAPPPAGTARLSLAGIAVAPAVTGSFGAALAEGALVDWQGRAASSDLTNLGVPPSVTGSPGTGLQPRAGAWGRAAGGTLGLAFQPGYAPKPPPGPVAPLTGTVTVAAPPRATVLPAIATRAFAAANGVRAGSVVAVPVGALTVRAKVVAVLPVFPTVTGPAGGLILDGAALQELLVSRQGPPLPVTSWWLRTAGAEVPPGLPAGSAISTQAARTAVLLGDPLSIAQQQILLLVTGAMVLLAVIGFVANVAVDLRAGRRRSALLGVLGVAPAARARLPALEQLLLSVPAALAGLLAGTGLAYLLVPSIILTATATTPVPPVLVTFPLIPEILLAVLVAAAPVLAAAVGALRGPAAFAGLAAMEAS